MSEVKIKARGSISLAEKCPELIKEWDYDKNDKGPEEYSYGSGKKVWWKCPKNHSYAAYIYHRVNGTNCPICSNKKLLVDYNDLCFKYPELISDWNFERNNLNPYDVIYSASQKVWWKCKKGHEWETSVVSRTKLKSGCPYCSGLKHTRGVNDLKTLNPNLANEWNYKKNGDISPSDVSRMSNKIVWWKCKKGHEWQASISNRSSGRGCPYCVGIKVLVGYNDLKTLYPEIAEQWDYYKNGKLKPTDLTTKSGKKVWWKCEKDHSWCTRVSDRTNGNNCPICSNHKILNGYNTLNDLDQKIIKEWNQEKNQQLKPTDIYSNSNKKVWWICEYGHEWKTSVYSRTVKNTGCPYCTGKKLLTGFNDLATKSEKLSNEWNIEKNEFLSPSEIMPGSKRKVWWKCNNGHEWEAAVSDRYCGGNNCPYCTGKKVFRGYNDLATKNKRITSEWNYSKNLDIKPTDVTCYSNETVWWKCKEGHEWQAKISNRTNGRGCPICDKHKKTSVPEKIVYYYIKKIFPDTKANFQPIWLNGKEIDVYIPTLDFSYEYDGRWHDIDKDLKKDKIFEQLGKLIVRSREPGLPELNDNSICLNIEKIDSKYKYMNEEVHRIISLINEQYNINITIDIDVERDLSEVFFLMEYSIAKNSLAKTHTNLLKDWDYTKNTLKPEYVSHGSNKKVWWKCDKCGFQWEAIIANRSSGKGCPECGKKKRLITRNENKLKKMQYIAKTAEAS